MAGDRGLAGAVQGSRVHQRSVESESLVALDQRTGQEKWRARGIRESWNTPLVVTADSGRQELIVAVQGSVLALDPDSGQQLWSCKTDIGWYMVPAWWPPRA